MNKQQLLDIIDKVVQREVARQVSLIKMQIISEVSGMLQYTERKILSEVGDRPTSGIRDIDRVTSNLKSMPNYDNGILKPKRREKKTYVSDPTLNDLLNDTAGFNRDEMFEESDDFMVPVSRAKYDEPWTNYRPQPTVTAKSPLNGSISVPKSMTGTDGKPIDTSDEKVRSVLEIISNTDYSAKLKKINEAGERFRNGGMPIPVHSSVDFNGE